MVSFIENTKRESGMESYNKEAGKYAVSNDTTFVTGQGNENFYLRRIPDSIFYSVITYNIVKLTGLE